MTIQSFKDERCDRILRMQPPGRGFPADLIAGMRRRLIALHLAGNLEGLALEAIHRVRTAA